MGTHIYALAAQVQPGQRWLKRVVAEMGGKDAIIVDETADLDAAAEGITDVGVRLPGPEVLGRVARDRARAGVPGRARAQVARRAEALRVGPAEDPATQVGGGHRRDAVRQGAERTCEVGQREGRLVVGGEPDGEEAGTSSRRSSPTCPRTARLAQEEIFGPLLSFIRARDYDARAGDRQRHRVWPDRRRVLARPQRAWSERAAEFHVGNLYLNRKITGAMVGAQPFGGFNMSGTDSKAGGPDYLQLFMQAKVVVERF